MQGVVEVLDAEQWRSDQREHERTADDLTAAHRERRAHGKRHPVWDFMFTYYPVKPAALRRWSPGAGVGLDIDGTGEGDESSADTSRLSGASYFHVVESSGAASRPILTVDTDAFLEKRGRAVHHIHRLLSATAARPASFGCFGMHEWAMVYRDAHRHPEPLRLGQDGTDRVVENSRLRCTHFDAFRFFTDSAAPRNALQPSRETQLDLEQPGCLHATMDLYKWATKLGPLVPGDLWLDTFRLACDVRQTDMEASPYDLSEWGFTPVAVETREGRAEYVRRQRSFAERGQALRRRLMALLENCYPELQKYSVTVEEPARATSSSK